MEKSFLQQTMKTGDWIKLVVVIVWSVFCWGLVWYEYSQPLSYDTVAQKILIKTQQAQAHK